MATIRQEKIGGLIQKELSTLFQKEVRTWCLGAMVSVTVVRVTPDLSLAKVYVSPFGVEDKEKVIKHLNKVTGEIRYNLAKIIRNQLRKTPELVFYHDDSYDYAKQINDLLNEG